MMNNFKMVAKTMFGFEPILAKELKNLGASYVKEGNRSVYFEGDTGFMYKANLSCRTAIKILKPIHTFKVKNEDDLYNGIYAMDWSQYMSEKDTLAIDGTTFSENFTHSKYVALKAKDAIVDQFREQTGIRPNVDLDHPTLRINIHIDRETCTVSLDSSGDSLHKRGYREHTNVAPINEVLAAGLLLMSGWDGLSHFHDPMCGSGTVLIEAAMIACNIPPNINRPEFAFEKWKDWDVDLFEKIEESCLNKIRGFDYTITGADESQRMVLMAQENIENANLAEFIKLKRQDFFASEKEVEGHLHMVFNPPYGERIELDNIQEFYANIGDTLKQGYPGSEAWFITSNLEAQKFVGLRPSRKLKVFNGKLESKFLKYEVYEGTKKLHKLENRNDD